MIIFQKPRVVRFASTLGQSYDLNEIQLTQREALLEHGYFTGSMPLLTTTTDLRDAVVPRLSPLQQFFGKVVENVAWEDMNATS